MRDTHGLVSEVLAEGKQTSGALAFLYDRIDCGDFDHEKQLLILKEPSRTKLLCLF